MATFTMDDFNRLKTISTNSAKMRQTLNAIPVKMNQASALQNANNFANAEAAKVPANQAIQQENFARANAQTASPAKQPTVLAKLRTTGSNLVPKAGGMTSKVFGGLGLATSGINMANNGVNADNATDAAVSAGLMTKNPMVAGGAAALGAGKFIGSNLLPESVQIMLAETLTGSKMPAKQTTTPEFDKYAALLAQEKAGETPEAFPQDAANQAADSFIDDIYGAANTQAAPETKAPNPSQDSIAAIRETLAQAQAERGKVVNPLQQQSNMELKDYSNNPFAAVMQLQRAVGQMAPYAASNKIARENAANLTTDAQKQAGLVELENTLKNSSITQEKGQLELAQSKRLNDAMVKLGTLTDEKERRALQDSILTMLGKEPKDDYVIQEVGGGTDANGIPQPKRAVVFDKRTGQVVSEVGGGANGAGQPAAGASQYKVGQQYNIGGKVVKVTGMDKDGSPIFDDDI